MLANLKCRVCTDNQMHCGILIHILVFMLRVLLEDTTGWYTFTYCLVVAPGYWPLTLSHNTCQTLPLTFICYLNQTYSINFWGCAHRYARQPSRIHTCVDGLTFTRWPEIQKDLCSLLFCLLDVQCKCVLITTWWIWSPPVATKSINTPLMFTL